MNTIKLITLYLDFSRQPACDVSLVSLDHPWVRNGSPFDVVIEKIREQRGEVVLIFEEREFANLSSAAAATGTLRLPVLNALGEADIFVGEADDDPEALGYRLPKGLRVELSASLVSEMARAAVPSARLVSRVSTIPVTVDDEKVLLDVYRAPNGALFARERQVRYFYEAQAPGFDPFSGQTLILSLPEWTRQIAFVPEGENGAMTLEVADVSMNEPAAWSPAGRPKVVFLEVEHERIVQAWQAYSGLEAAGRRPRVVLESWGPVLHVDVFEGIDDPAGFLAQGTPASAGEFFMVSGAVLREAFGYVEEWRGLEELLSGLVPNWFSAVEVHPVKQEALSDGGASCRRPEPGEGCDFYSVYLRYSEEASEVGVECVGDRRDRAQALAFARALAARLEGLDNPCEVMDFTEG